MADYLRKMMEHEFSRWIEFNADWQRAAASLLVSIGAHLPDLMMEEIFLHISGPNSALPAMVQILADFASAEALQFAPQLKSVLSRVLPILGNVRDAQRPIFANVWASSRDLKNTKIRFRDHTISATWCIYSDAPLVHCIVHIFFPTPGNPSCTPALLSPSLPFYAATDIHPSVDWTCSSKRSRHQNAAYAGSASDLISSLQNLIRIAIAAVLPLLRQTNHSSSPLPRNWSLSDKKPSSASLHHLSLLTRRSHHHRRCCSLWRKTQESAAISLQLPPPHIRLPHRVIFFYRARNSRLAISFVTDWTDGWTHHEDTVKDSLAKARPHHIGIVRYLFEHLHNVLNASLLSESGPPLLDFEELTAVLLTLLPVASMKENNQYSDFSVGLKTKEDTQRDNYTNLPQVEVPVVLVDSGESRDKVADYDWAMEISFHYPYLLELVTIKHKAVVHYHYHYHHHHHFHFHFHGPYELHRY
ncbi:hypothetical protein ACLOJK_025263 [Asimina triloba]